MTKTMNQIYRMAAEWRWLAVSALAFAGEVQAQSPSTPPLGTRELLNAGASLVVIVAAIVAFGWLYSRFHSFRGRNHGVIHVLAAQALGAKERVLLVEVAGKHLVIGVTASQIRTLHVLDQPLPQNHDVASPSSFAERLRAIVAGAGK